MYPNYSVAIDSTTISCCTVTAEFSNLITANASHRSSSRLYTCLLHECASSECTSTKLLVCMTHMTRSATAVLLVNAHTELCYVRWPHVSLISAIGSPVHPGKCLALTWRGTWQPFISSLPTPAAAVCIATPTAAAVAVTATVLVASSVAVPSATTALIAAHTAATVATALQ
jgi:hypothetical protein